MAEAPRVGERRPLEDGAVRPGLDRVGSGVVSSCDGVQEQRPRWSSLSRVERRVVPLLLESRMDVMRTSLGG